jgi:Flp pilus assembly protein TadG
LNWWNEGKTMRIANWKTVGPGGESGQALIETAFSVALLLVLLTFVADLAQTAFAAIEATNAARAAAQYAAMNGGHYLATTTSGLDEQGMLRAANADAGNLSGSITFGSGYPTVSCNCLSGATATCSGASYPPPSCSDSTTPVVTVTVQTKASFSPPIWGSMIFWGSGGSQTAMTLYGWDVEQVIGN